MEYIKKGIVNILNFFSEIIEVASQPLYNLIAIAIPFFTPIQTALFVRDNLVKYNGTTLAMANRWAIIFEGLGIFVLSSFVIALLSWVRSKNPKVKVFVWFLGALVIIYLATILTINVALEIRYDVEPISIFINFLLCLTPIVSSSVFGYHRLVTLDEKEHLIEKTKAEEQAEKIRLEKVAEQKRRWDIKHGILPQQSNQQPLTLYNLDVPPVVETRDTPKKDWRLLNKKERYEVKNKLSVKEIVEKYGIGESTAFAWKSKRE